MPKMAKHSGSAVRTKAGSDQLVQELLIANEELEQFAHVAAHDLRDPMRTIASFTSLLSKEYAGKLDETGQSYIDIIHSAAVKMEAVLVDMLEYANVVQLTDENKQVDVNQVIRQVVEVLQPAIAATGAVIHSQTLPKLLVNPVRFARLMQNLISNAIKYQRAGNVPQIHVTVSEQGKHWLFSVADNGIGIEAAYLQTIFDPFKRLHSQQEYQGSGLGLAICRKIVATMNGQIWAESIPGKGSVFYFTLPKK
jgi:light-regulated signal transduction histidine kinase (bacteriophytochrome)